MQLAAELGGDVHAVRAAELCKIDLTTELVKEFTELQGVVGGLYARVQGESEPVWQAIYDHYKPESMEDAIPRNRTAQIVALADKLDTLRGCFGVGLIPTGSRDPFALRRAAQGVVRILIEGRFDLSLFDFIGDDEALRAFFAERVRYYFKDIRGFAYDEINACMAASVGWGNLVDLEARLGTCAAARQSGLRTPGRRLQTHCEYPGTGQRKRLHSPSVRHRRSAARSRSGTRTIRGVPTHRRPARRKRDLAPASQDRPLF